MDAQLLGKFGEILASRYLRCQGYDVASANYLSRLGEIDLVAEDKKFICFVEVKTRSEKMLFSPSDAVDYSKRNKIISTSQLFIKENRIKKQVRYDIIEVFFENDEPVKINHIKNAFDANGR